MGTPRPASTSRTRTRSLVRTDSETLCSATQCTPPPITDLDSAKWPPSAEPASFLQPPPLPKPRSTSSPELPTTTTLSPSPTAPVPQQLSLSTQLPLTRPPTNHSGSPRTTVSPKPPTVLISPSPSLSKSGCDLKPAMITGHGFSLKLIL